MNKSDVIKLFGGVSETARALGIRPQAVSQWPDRLSDRVSDRIRGAAARLGIQLPKRLAA